MSVMALIAAVKYVCEEWGRGGGKVCVCVYNCVGVCGFDCVVVEGSVWV